jgi:GH15 family glucan-1,4-alpha-glucosidase
MMAIVAERTGKATLELGAFSGEFVAKAGQDALLTLIVADHAPLVVPSVAEVRQRRETTEVAWREWCDTVPYQGADRELVLRSMLALKLLTYAPTGAMAAAATTSLPERIGGERNYDYRYGCWSQAKRSYVGHAGSDKLDASLLLLARSGFLDGKDRRFTQTIRAIRAELAEGPLLYRFTGADKIEGTFVACSFWLIDALVRNGHEPAARKLWRELTAYSSELGLLAEEIDPDTGAFLGNLPQGLSHLALLNAAALLDI